MKTFRVFVAGVLAVATACSDISGPGALSGNLSFSHSGATSGTFSASGSVLAADPQAVDWAAGVRDDQSQSIAIAAHIPRANNTSDEVAIEFPQLTTGTVNIANNGAHVAMAFGQPQSGTPTWSCALTSGSVVLTSLSSTRASGSFSGTGTCTGSTGGPTAFTVTEGSFDVPLVDAGSF